MVEYALAVVIIGLAAVLTLGFVGRATGGSFGEIGDAFPTSPPAEAVAAPDFDQLLALLTDRGAGNSLYHTAEEARRSYLEGNTAGALHKLDTLIKQINAQQGKQLSLEDAAEIRTVVQQLIHTVDTG